MLYGALSVAMSTPDDAGAGIYDLMGKACPPAGGPVKAPAAVGLPLRRYAARAAAFRRRALASRVPISPCRGLSR